MKKKPSRWNLVISAILLVLFVGFLACVMIWERIRPNPEILQPVSTAPLDAAETTAAPAVTTVPTEMTLPEFDARKRNFLLVGRDAHGEGENGRSDAMILCSVDTGKQTVTMISFLRDIYLPIPGHGSNRLNAAYSWGGAELLVETLEANFGVTIDVTLEIDFEGFKGLIDQLGGVEIDLTDREANHLNNSHPDWNLTEGSNRLDGTQALAYSRIRYLDSDFGRTERQRNVLSALMYKYRSASLVEMLNVTDAFLDQSTSDHTDDELLNYALELYSLLDDGTLTTHRVPADGTYSYETIRGMSVVAIDFEENIQLLEDLLS